MPLARLPKPKMDDFNKYLDESGEIGYVDKLVYSICQVSGIPNVRPNELVVFETGDIGQVFSIGKDSVEILFLSGGQIRSGSRLTRTGDHLKIGVGKNYMGRAIDPLGRTLDGGKPIKPDQYRYIDENPPELVSREHINKPLETGVSIVDTIVPLAKGQRELIIGDRKTGKSQFLIQTILSQAKLGTVCIYAVIGQRQVEILRLVEFFREKGIINNTIVVAASSSDPSGMVYLTPYSAMTMAEFFRDAGMDVLLVLDDLTSHARNYREISLLAKRFPGRSSYPGDIFYIHAKLLERAGNFKKGSITCLPSAESILGDLSGYIQTNIMAMTDGHIFFDIDLYNKGKRPAINPFLSVTRVGHEAQTALQKDMSREVLSFLVQHEKMKSFMHFGAEIGENIKKILNLGERLTAYYNQLGWNIIPNNVNSLILAGLWVGLWRDVKVEDMKDQMERVLLDYMTNAEYKKEVDELLSKMNRFSELIDVLRQEDKIITKKLSV